MDAKLIEQFTNSLANLHALVIGDSMLDRYVIGSISRISPEAPVPVLSMDSLETKLGGAANVALNVQSIGSKVTLVSVVGSDSAGNVFLEKMVEAGLNKELIDKTERKTTVKTRIISANQHVLRVDEEDTAPIDRVTEEKIVANVTHVLERDKPDVLIFQDYNKGLITEWLITEIIKLAQGFHVPICVDPKKDHFFQYKGVSIFKPNLAEVQAAVPFKVGSDQESLDRADQYLREQIHHKKTIITLGRDGIYLSDGLQSLIVPTIPRSIIDVCGAGDAVIASVALASLSPLPLEVIGHIGNAAGGLVCEEVGVAPIPKDRFIHELLKN